MLLDDFKEGDENSILKGKILENVVSCNGRLSTNIYDPPNKFNQ
jgi:hypothetical protein